MKNQKVVFGVIAGILVFGAVVGFLLGGNNAKNTVDTPSKHAGMSHDAVKACSLLTKAEAQKLLGTGIKSNDQSPPASTNNVNVDTCSYTNGAQEVANIKVVTVLVRSGLTDEGMDSNTEAFEKGGAANPAGAQAIGGYGEKAYWDPTAKQLAILRDNTWIAIVYGGINPIKNNLDDAKKVAELVLN